MLRFLFASSLSAVLAAALSAVPAPADAIVAAVQPGAFEVELRTLPTGAPLAGGAATTDVTQASCDDGSTGGTLVQRVDAWYGNRFASVCTAARLQSASFVHFGYGLEGPYAFRLHLVDSACREIGVTAVLTTPGAPDAVATAEVDLLPYGWCVNGDFHLLLEPLTCADGATGHDCFPAVVVDATADGDPAAHCAIVDVLAGTERQCWAARSADGRYFDFGLRAALVCDAPECTTGVENATWSGVKRLYRDPAPRSRD